MKEEKGAALVLSLMLITLFLLFILVLFNQVVNTTLQVSTMEENIDARMIAEMGVDYVEHVLNDFPRSELTLDDYLNDNIHEAQVQVDDVRYFEINIQDFDLEAHPGFITYESTGTAKGQKETIENQINVIWDEAE